MIDLHNADFYFILTTFQDYDSGPEEISYTTNKPSHQEILDADLVIGVKDNKSKILKWRDGPSQ